MKEPKKVKISEDGTKVTVGKKEMNIDDLSATGLALVLKEESKGFLKQKKDLSGKIQVYNKASIKAVLLGWGAFILAQCFQSVDVLETLARSAEMALFLTSLGFSFKSLWLMKKRSDAHKEHEDTQLSLGTEIVRRELKGENTEEAEKILEEEIEEEKE